VIRLVQTLRGGFKPKGWVDELSDVSGMPRSCWERWGIFRKRFDGTTVDNLRKWDRRFTSPVESRAIQGCDRLLAHARRAKGDCPHLSLKPQRFLPGP
jgi:site-specific DNA-methyltransferase (adenine-specific)